MPIKRWSKRLPSNHNIYPNAQRPDIGQSVRPPFFTFGRALTLCLAAAALFFSGMTINIFIMPLQGHQAIPQIANNIATDVEGPATGNAQNLVPDPDFADGTAGFSSDYTIQGPAVTGTIRVGDNPNPFNWAWLPTIKPYVPPSMLMVDGAPYPQWAFWRIGPVPVKPDTTYYFSVYAASLYQDNPAIVQFNVNGVQAGAAQLLTPNVGGWAKYGVEWQSGQNTTAVLSLTDQNTLSWGNDFAIDDVSFSPRPR